MPAQAIVSNSWRGKSRPKSAEKEKGFGRLILNKVNEERKMEQAQIKETLEKQFELLSERSKETSGKELADLTNTMINLAAILLPEFQSQSFYAASINHPYVVQLPIKDLIELYVARAERANECGRASRI